MKTLRFLMPAVLLTMLLSLAGCGSASNGASKYTPQDSIASIVANKLIQDREFVMTASTLTIGPSRMLSVAESNNFILIDGEKCVVQMDPMNGSLRGPLTASGTISGYKVTRGKNGDTHIRFTFRGRVTSGDISITMYDKSNVATAQINATFWKGRATMRGRIQPIKASVIALPKDHQN